MGMSWSREEVNGHLRKIMIKIHEQCVEYGRIDDNYVDYVKGANIAGFMKVAIAMVDLGVV
ncbi:MAG: glutamate dehydrogenase, partial [Candidatus Marinimicrobia bacterium]|nr:glutamate dehydrogenase [Candidatus Neomarinimicrobiota bacterium]